jgi:hypothetical protein
LWQPKVRQGVGIEILTRFPAVTVPKASDDFEQNILIMSTTLTFDAQRRRGECAEKMNPTGVYEAICAE